MKKGILLFAFHLICLFAYSQEDIFINIMRNDGESFSLKQKDVTDIAVSYYDFNQELRPYATTQLILTDYLSYRIPLKSIDSISFNQKQKIDNNQIYYTVIPGTSSDLGYNPYYPTDSIMITSNGYYYLMHTDENNITTLVADTMEIMYADGTYYKDNRQYDNGILFRFDSLGQVISIYSKGYYYCLTYRDNLVDVYSANNGILELYDSIPINKVKRAAPRDGGIEQFSFWNRINTAFSIANLIKEGVKQSPTFILDSHFFGWQQSADKFVKNAEFTLGIGLVGSALSTGVKYLVFGEVCIPLFIIEGGLNGMSYLEKKQNQMRNKNYELFAGRSSINALGHDKVNDNSYTFKARVNNYYSIPSEYSSSNSYGIVLSKNRNNVSIFDKDAIVYYNYLDKEDQIDITLNCLEKNCKYYYRFFLMTPLDKQIYEHGLDNIYVDNFIGKKYYTSINYSNELLLNTYDPTPVTIDSYDISFTSAYVTCSFEGVPENGTCGVEYMSGEETIKLKSAITEGSSSLYLSNLEPGTSYSYRAYIETSDSIYYGLTQNFTTAPNMSGNWIMEEWRYVQAEDNPNDSTYTCVASYAIEVDKDGTARTPLSKIAVYPIGWGRWSFNANGTSSIYILQSSNTANVFLVSLNAFSTSQPNVITGTYLYYFTEGLYGQYHYTIKGDAILRRQ